MSALKSTLTASMRARLLTVLLLGLATACGGALRDGVFIKDGVRYRVAALDPREWKGIGLAGNDLAWAAARSSHLISINATCDNHGDPSLEVLTNHLVFGFTDRELKDRKPLTLDGRDALDSRYEAKLDGVPVELRLVVLKKNGCVHDLSYIAPQGDFEARAADFQALVDGFAQLQGP